MFANNFCSKVLLGACLGTLSLFPSVVRAQVSVSPMVIESQAKRGQAQAMITLRNTNSTPTRVRVYAEPFTYKRDLGFQVITSNPNDLSPYLQYSPRELTIKPGQSRRVRLMARLAPSLPDGEYRAVVFNETLTESKDGAGNNVALVARIGITFYVRKGNVIPKLGVDGASFNTDVKKIQLLVRNSGQASALSGVNWTLKRGDQVVKTGKLEPSAVIADSDRHLLLNFPNEEKLAAGTYELSGELVWGNDDKKSKLPFKMNVNIPTITASSNKPDDGVPQP